MNAPNTLLAAAFALLLTVATPAAAAPEVDVEIDPLAYALGGYSLHAGLNWDHLRLDLGAFAMDLPSWVHGNEGFDASFDGFGAKLQVFAYADGSGPFAGVSGGWARALVRRSGTDLARRDGHLTLGAQIGWRFDLPAGFYATPWLGVDYTLGSEDVELGDARFESQALQLFPTVHLGYRF